MEPTFTAVYRQIPEGYAAFVDELPGANSRRSPSSSMPTGFWGINDFTGGLASSGLEHHEPNFDELREKVSAPIRRSGVVRAGIFGSVARGEAGEGSDVDFLVDLEKGRSLVDLAGLRLDLCDLLKRDVDLATPNSPHPKLRERILSELVPLL